MNFIGVDLHKKVISVCVIVQEGRSRKVLERATLACADTGSIVRFFRRWRPFQMAVEATASYEWFVQLVEPLAERVVLVHPKKLRVIAESKHKSDKLDAFVIAEFLALDMLPEAFRPTARQREHRTLVRQRAYVQRRITSAKNKLRHVLARYNADVRGLFSAAGRQYLAEFALSAADRFLAEQLLEELSQHQARLKAADRQLRAFAKAAPIAEREARDVLDSVPCVGPVTIEVVLSELGDVRRFRSAKQVTSYAGLAPGQRASAGHRQALGITKEGSRLLRWALVETAWRLVVKTRRWGLVYEQLQRRTGAKKAIVAVARRVLCVLTALLRSGQKYRLASDEMPPPMVRPASRRAVLGLAAQAGLA
jgi:transposase